jgi:hypothetical protein
VRLEEGYLVEYPWLIVLGKKRENEKDKTVIYSSRLILPIKVFLRPKRSTLITGRTRYTFGSLLTRSV